MYKLIGLDKSTRRLCWFTVLAIGALWAIELFNRYYAH